MSSNGTVDISGEVLQPHKTDALTIVLGACILIIGLCSFTVIILLIQKFQRAKPRVAPAEIRPARRAAKSTAVTTQYRPLSEAAIRKQKESHVAPSSRQASGTFPLGVSDNSSPCSTSSAGLAPDFAIRSEPVPSYESSTPAPASTLAAAPAASPAAAPSRLANCAVEENKPCSDSDTVARPHLGDKALPMAYAAASKAAAAAAVAGRQSASSEASTVLAGKSSDSPIDNIDLGLLTRIDQALASGVMKPEDATRLLKSYGCDLEELLREELQEGQHGSGVFGSGGVVHVATSLLAPAPVLRASSAVGLSGAPASAPFPTDKAAATGCLGSGPGPALALQTSTSNPASPKFFAQGGGVVTSYARPVFSPGLGLRPQQRSGLSRSNSNAASSGVASGVGGIGGGGAEGSAGSKTGGPVLDDEMLRKLDLALASGAVRPDQASQLLKSVGCDLEELLREEFGGQDEL